MKPHKFVLCECLKAGNLGIYIVIQRPISNITANLDQTPPHRELKVSDPNVKDKTLLDLQLAPASVLMFRFLDEAVDIASKCYMAYNILNQNAS